MVMLTAAEPVMVMRNARAGEEDFHPQVGVRLVNRKNPAVTLLRLYQQIRLRHSAHFQDTRREHGVECPRAPDRTSLGT